MDSPLAGKNVVVTGDSQYIDDKVEQISMNLRGVRITGIPINELHPGNAGDVVLATDSLDSGKMHGLREVSRHVSDKVANRIPVVVMLLNGAVPIVRDEESGAIGVVGVRSLPEALRIALGL